MTKEKQMPAGKSTAKEEPCAFLLCDYDEFKENTYRGAILRMPRGGEIRIFSDSPSGDKYLAQRIAEYEKWRLCVSSSWDNYYADAVNHFA